MIILVSACLLGVECRYDGESKPNDAVLVLLERHTLIPVCGEVMGGLPTPRVPSERRGDSVFNAEGADVTAAYRRGAAEVARLAHLYGAKIAILKERSPACGSGQIYDGTFTHTLTEGWGVTAEALGQHGVAVYGESQVPRLVEQGIL